MIEKILDMLEAREKHHKNMANSKTGVLSEIDKVLHLHFAECFTEAKEIVQKVAKEYGKDTNVRSNGWIPCSERLPEEQDEYLVYWTAEGFKGKCFYEIIEYHLEDGWIGKIPQAPFGKYTVIAWMPLPSAPYQKGE